MVNLHDNCVSSFLDLVIEKFSVIIHNDPQRQKLRSSSSKINRGLKIMSTLSLSPNKEFPSNNVDLSGSLTA